jgi:hypothetical protein
VFSPAHSVGLNTVTRSRALHFSLAANYFAGVPATYTLDVIRRAFEAAGVEFIDENGGGPGVRLRKQQQKKA